MLSEIEPSLMPPTTGRRFEYETALAAGDALSAHFHGDGRADEVRHVRIGRALGHESGVAGVGDLGPIPIFSE